MIVYIFQAIPRPTLWAYTADNTSDHLPVEAGPWLAAPVSEIDLRSDDYVSGFSEKAEVLMDVIRRQGYALTENALLVDAV